MTVLVFGKTGQVARELAHYSDVRCLDRAEADLSLPSHCGNMIRRLKPEAVINAAADDGVRLRVVIDQVASVTESRLERLEPA